MSSGQVAGHSSMRRRPIGLVARNKRATNIYTCVRRQANQLGPAMRRRSQMALDIRISRARVTLIKPIDLSYEC